MIKIFFVLAVVGQAPLIGASQESYPDLEACQAKLEERIGEVTAAIEERGIPREAFQIQGACMDEKDMPKPLAPEGSEDL